MVRVNEKERWKKAGATFFLPHILSVAEVQSVLAVPLNSIKMKFGGLWLGMIKSTTII